MPELFKQIIQHDREDPRRLSVVALTEYAEWRKKRRSLTEDAERFIVRQKGGTPNARP